VKEKEGPAGVFYYWKGERPMDPDAPQLHGMGEIRLESVDRASGYWTTRSDTQPDLNARTSASTGGQIRRIWASWTGRTMGDARN
jgi:hypothetical protein